MSCNLLSEAENSGGTRHHILTSSGNIKFVPSERFPTRLQIKVSGKSGRLHPSHSADKEHTSTVQLLPVKFELETAEATVPPGWR